VGGMWPFTQKKPLSSMAPPELPQLPELPKRGITWSNRITGQNLPTRYNGVNGNGYMGEFTGNELTNLQVAARSAPKRSFTYRRRRNNRLNPDELQLFTNIWTRHNDFNDMEEEIQSLNTNIGMKQRLLMELKVRTENAPNRKSFLVGNNS